MTTHRFRRSARFALAAVLLAAGVTAGVDREAPTAEAAPLAIDVYDPATRPLGPITIFGDSVLKGSFLYAPTVADQLAARGWGPIRGRTGVGNSTHLSGNTESNAVYWIDLWRSVGWDAPDVFINLGANDSGHCRTNLACARNAILTVVDKLGPGHRVWWPKITQYPYNIAWQHTWNTALDQIAAERPDFFTWDWPAAIVAHQIPMATDYIHSTPSGYRTRSDLMAAQITNDLATAKQVGGDAPLPRSIGDPTEYVALTPERVRDTRDRGAAMGAGGTVRIDVTSLVPDGTTAVAVNLTTAESNDAGYLSAHPCDRPLPEASNVNHAPGAARGALAIVPLSADGELCVFTRASGHVIVDLQGAFVAPGATADAARLTAVNPPERLLDTRESGRAEVSVVDVPEGVDAVAVNLTATDADGPGWLKAWDCSDDEPLVSNVNYGSGESIAGAAIVTVSDDSTICVRTLVPSDVIVDLTGTLSADGTLRFVPANPTRVFDTRTGLGGWSPIHGAGQTLDVRAVPPEAEAVTGTLTIVTPTAPGYLSLYDCGAPPPTSNVNADAGGVLANAVTVGVDDDGRVCAFARSSTGTLLDVTGWWVP